MSKDGKLPFMLVRSVRDGEESAAFAGLQFVDGS